jgi:hypothetical protein
MIPDRRNAIAATPGPKKTTYMYFTIISPRRDAGLGGGLLAYIDKWWCGGSTGTEGRLTPTARRRRGSHDAGDAARRGELVGPVRRRAVERDVVHGPRSHLDLEARKSRTRGHDRRVE